MYYFRLHYELQGLRIRGYDLELEVVGEQTRSKLDYCFLNLATNNPHYLYEVGAEEVEEQQKITKVYSMSLLEFVSMSWRWMIVIINF